MKSNFNKRPGQWVKNYLAKHIQVIQALNQNDVVRLIKIVNNVYQASRQIFIIGNGGSAATASHLAVDLGQCASLARARSKSAKRFKVFTPADQTIWVTSLANDLSYADIFAEQIKNFAQRGDLLIALSVSGNSPNILKAVKYARQNGLKTVGLTGDRKGKLTKLVHLPIIVPSKHYGHVQDGHDIITHILSYYFIENK